VILSLFALFTMFGPWLADYNETHIFNPLWTPHAKFHNAQTIMLGTFLGLLTLAFLWAPMRRWAAPGARLDVAVLFGALYWAAQMFCILFPGTAFRDPEFPGLAPVMGVEINQSRMSFLFLLIMATCWYFERRRLARQAAPSPNSSTRREER
jgi:hypothetical protein